MHFCFPQKVLFKHCDPAGIVFYPRYFEMLNDAVEAMFNDVLKWPFEEIHRQQAVPTVAMDIQFKAPSRHGDLLTLQITVEAIGGSSLSLRTRAISDEQTRFEVRHTLVYVGPDGKPTRWPDHIRQIVNGLIEDQQ